MASEVEEPFSLNFQLDSFRSGSISFGRYENEALCWERWSSFSQNRYLEEVEKCSKPGSVTEKKAYFEAQFKKKLAQNSPESQNEIESQTSENDNSEKRDYNEETTTTFHGSVYKTEEFGNSFSEPQIERTSDITKKPNNHEIEEKTDACLKEKRDISPKEKIPSSEVKYTKPQVSDGQSRRNTSTNSSKISENKSNKTIPSKSRAEIKTSNAPSKYERGSKIKGAGKGSINRTSVDPQSSTAQKVSSRVHQSANRAKQDIGANKAGLRQDNSRFGLKSDERPQRRKELEEKMHAKKAELPQLRTKTQEKTKVETKQLSKSLNSRAIPTPSLYRGLREPAGNKDISTNTKPQKPTSKSSSTPGSRVSKNTTSNARAKTSDQPQASRATSSHSTLTSDSSTSSSAVTRNAQKIPSVVSEKKDVQKEKLKPNQNTKIGRSTNTYTSLNKSSRMGHVAVGVAS